MAKGKNSGKPKENFKHYDAATVPDIMPLPQLARVVTTLGQEIAVPKLNEHQRSWIHDVGIRGVDLPNLDSIASKALYAKVKIDAFDAKAFQHQAQPKDHDEEAQISAFITAWKKDHAAKQNNNRAAEQEADDDDEEEDEGSRTGLVRGYTKAGWRMAIQKVISNKRTAEGNKRKKIMKDAKTTDAKDAKDAQDDSEESVPQALALSKLLGLVADTGRDKFREDRHDEIHEYSKTLPATINAGGRFRKAEAELWAKQDQAAWEAVAASNEDVDWAERQKLVARGFEHLVDTLHASHRFRPFVATMLVAWLDERGRVQLEWAEAVPKDISVPQTFQKTHATLVEDNLNCMVKWAEKPLRDYMATLEDSAKGAVPVFPLTVDALEEVTPKELAEIVVSFLAESYEAAFGTREIPWATIANEPGAYYDTTKFLLRFTSDGLAQLSRNQRLDLATALASDAGRGSSGFFRKELHPPPPPPSPPRSPSPLAEEREPEAEKREAEEREREAARLRREAEEREAEEREAEKHEAEAARLRREAEEREAEEYEAEAARLRREAEEREREAEKREAEEREREAEAARFTQEVEEHEREAERLRREAEEEEEEVPLAPKKTGKKRKAHIQLVPEDAGASGRPSRARKTPKEAELECAAKLKTTVRDAGKPRYEYVARSPVKAKGARGSTTRYSLQNLSYTGTQVQRQNLSFAGTRVHGQN
ncbi:hypothetical protein B0H11DRAFT_1927954 [Mycena galericulata]|nr:hypothetical protein B0H11DRAFT_1927954 [Mycena galericulata]